MTLGSHRNPKRKLPGYYAQWINQLTEEGWEAWMVTFMFAELHLSPYRTKAFMQDQVTHWYKRLLTRVVANPRGVIGRRLRPILIGCPDVPVFKRDHKHPPLMHVNGGLHFGAVVLLPRPRYPPYIRLKVPLDRHVEENWRTYRWIGSEIDRIDLELINRTPEKAAQYTLKAIENGLVGRDNLLVLPEHLSELTKSGRQMQQ